MNKSKGKCFLVCSVSAFAADQPSKTGTFCISEATHPQHVTVIGRRPPFNYHFMSAPCLNWCINTIFYVLWSEQFRIKSTLLRSRQTSPASATLLPLGNVDRARLRCTDTNILLSAKIFKFDMVCKQKRAYVPSISWNVLHELKPLIMHPCGQAK